MELLFHILNIKVMRELRFTDRKLKFLKTNIVLWFQMASQLSEWGFATFEMRRALASETKTRVLSSEEQFRL